MATQKTKFAVGLFVAIGFTLAILVFIWLGMSRFLQKGRFYVTYFDESVLAPATSLTSSLAAIASTIRFEARLLPDT